MFYKINIDRNLGDISNINNNNEPIEIEKTQDITSNDAGKEIIVQPDHDNELMKKVTINCRFNNSIKTTGVELPYQSKLEELFNYSTSDYNQSQETKVGGFNNVNYKMKYPDNKNTTLFEVDEGEGHIRKYIKISLDNTDKENKYIGIHDDLLIPLDVTYNKQGNFITQAAKDAATVIGKQAWKVIATRAIESIPYVGSVIAGLINGGGTIMRQAAQIAWQNGNNYLPPAENNVSERSLKLYKDNEVPVIDKAREVVDLVRQDDPYAPGDENIVDDNEEPIWAGTTDSYFDILEELEYTMTSNNSTFTFDIDQYNSDPVVSAAPEGSCRPIGIKRVVIHTDIPLSLPQLDPSTTLITSNGTYDIKDSDNDPDDLEIEEQLTRIVKRDSNENNEINIGSFTVNVPPTPTQSKSVSYNSNGSYTIVPDSGYNLSSVNVDVNVGSTVKKINRIKFTIFTDNSYSNVLTEGIVNIKDSDKIAISSGSNSRVTVSKNSVFLCFRLTFRKVVNMDCYSHSFQFIRFKDTWDINYAVIDNYSNNEGYVFYTIIDLTNLLPSNNTMYYNFSYIDKDNNILFSNINGATSSGSSSQTYSFAISTISSGYSIENMMMFDTTDLTFPSVIN